jgi:hypothetical protein
MMMKDGKIDSGATGKNATDDKLRLNVDRDKELG